MIFPAPMRSECAVLACSGVMVPETNLKLLAQTSWWIPLPISPVRSSRWSMGSNPQARAATFKQAAQYPLWHLASFRCDAEFGPLSADIVAKVENRTTQKISRKLIFGLLCGCIAL